MVWDCFRFIWRLQQGWFEFFVCVVGAVSFLSAPNSTQPGARLAPLLFNLVLLCMKFLGNFVKNPFCVWPHVIFVQKCCRFIVVVRSNLIDGINGKFSIGFVLINFYNRTFILYIELNFFLTKDTRVSLKKGLQDL